MLVVGLVWFFQKTRNGRALRAVSDDHEAALSVGIPLLKAWYLTWIIAGVVATVAGVAWGTRLGVQFSLSYIASSHCRCSSSAGLTVSPAPSLRALLWGPGKTWARSLSGHMWGEAFRPFSPISWPCLSSISNLTVFSAKRS